jgi:CubicO group peptidase (beta-lactamase class C family)
MAYDPAVSGPVATGLRAYSHFVAQQAAADQFSGTVLLAHRGRPVLARSWGMADKERSIPNRPGTMFGLASLGKIFTGAAIGQLAARGDVDLFATVGTYLDGFPAEIAGTVTVHQMFTHTSGMGNYMNSPVWQREARSWTTPAQEFADTMAIIQQSGLQFTPGTAYSYSNSGYYTLGAIVAQVSGQPFGDYLSTHVFGPAGMTHTGNYTTAQILASRDIAHAYGAPQPDGSRVDLTTAPGQFVSTGGASGAGGGYSSAPDLLGFALALNSGKLIDPGYTEVITTGKYPISPTDTSDQPPDPSVMVCYGFEERVVNNHRIFGHGGASPVPGGIATDLSIYADLDWVAVLLSNYYVNTLPYLELEDQILTSKGARA